jgi:geranylgeranyl diphosphate synthase type II
VVEHDILKPPLPEAFLIATIKYYCILRDAVSHTFQFTDYAEHFALLDSGLSSALGLSDQCPDILKESMEYSLVAGGKRLRPLLVLLANSFCGGDIKQAIRLAVAVELIHTYSLIHDDLPAMDDDDLRRGRPTNHIVYGEANAILAGDGLLTLAFEEVAKANLPPVVVVNCIKVLASAAGAEGMVGGQVADLLAETSTVSSLNELKQIHHRKTGRLIMASLEMGGLAAGANEPTLRALRAYGKNIGLAFQVVDDILDCTSSSEILGKGVQKDESRGKATFPTLLGLEESRGYAHNLIKEACDLLAPWGEQAADLMALAEYILARDR